MTRFQRALGAALAAAALIGAAGCAPTQTSQSTGEIVDDAAVTARVKSALINEPGVKSTAINVETFRGTVSLSGFVDSDEMARKATDAAEKVRGVRSVKNDMRVKPAS
jgi:osmotically-inducible protein OsmY